MIEQGIYFALGSIVTALLALLFAPVFWHRALRLTRQRLQLQVPLSMQEIVAERDQLRAEFAVERLRIEQALERVQATKDQDMAEIGRRSMQTVALSDQVEALRGIEAAQNKEIARILRDVAEAEGETGALRVALHDAQTSCDAWRQRAETARDHQEHLENEIDTHRTTIASLKTRSMGLEMRLTDAERARAARERELEAGLRARLETAMGHVARHENAGLLLRRELDDAKARIRQLEDELAAFGVPGPSTGREAAIDGAESRRELAVAADDVGLRESIHALGLAVARLTRQARETSGSGGEPSRRISKEEAARPIGVA